MAEFFLPWGMGYSWFAIRGKRVDEFMEFGKATSSPQKAHDHAPTRDPEFEPAPFTAMTKYVDLIGLSKGDVQAVFDTVAETAADICGAAHGLLMRREGEARTINPGAAQYTSEAKGRGMTGDLIDLDVYPKPKSEVGVEFAVGLVTTILQELPGLVLDPNARPQPALQMDAATPRIP